MHLGVFGPRRVVAEDEHAEPVPPPYKLINNEYSLLDKSDFVFIDPVSTGFSRAVPGEKAEQFHEYKKDIEWVGEFIRTYATRNARWTSPKFIVGESYGTTRASGLAGYVQDKYGMYLNGVMLVSSILNFQTARFVPGNDLPFLLFLPSYTATAWYHGLLDDELQKDLQATLREVEEFALTEYNVALMRGDNLAADERKSIINKLARYTGLSTTYVEQTNYRINIYKFTKELLREERRTVGRLDSRFKGIDRDATGTTPEYDPLLSYIMGPYSSTLNNYIKRDLEFESEVGYEMMAPLYQKWKYEEANNSYLNVGETLRAAMTKNPFLKVIVLNGYFDLGTPYFATEYTFNHLDLDETLRNNFGMAYYEAGHMMYLHEPSLKKMREDLGKFIEQSK
jgi:carboxypeptidase C (cathepsin A)